MDQVVLWFLIEGFFRARELFPETICHHGNGVPPSSKITPGEGGWDMRRVSRSCDHLCLCIIRSSVCVCVCALAFGKCAHFTVGERGGSERSYIIIVYMIIT